MSTTNFLDKTGLTYLWSKIKAAIPTKVSELSNDSGYITGYTETDPTVPSWAKADTKPSYTASEVGAVPVQESYTSGTFDIDDFLSEGRFFFTTGCTLTNQPTGAANGWLEVFKNEDGTKAIQHWYQLGDFPKAFARRLDTSWSNWHRIDIGSNTLNTTAGDVSGAINEILSNTTATTFTGTTATNVSGNCQGIYIPLLKLVILSFNFTMSSSATAGTSTNLFTIGSTYRPSSTMYGSGYGKSSSSHGAIRVCVNSSGQVRQYTMSACTGGNGVLVYQI